MITEERPNTEDLNAILVSSSPEDLVLESKAEPVAPPGIRVAEVQGIPIQSGHRNKAARGSQGRQGDGAG